MQRQSRFLTRGQFRGFSTQSVDSRRTESSPRRAACKAGPLNLFEVRSTPLAPQLRRCKKAEETTASKCRRHPNFGIDANWFPAQVGVEAMPNARVVDSVEKVTKLAEEYGD